MKFLGNPGLFLELVDDGQRGSQHFNKQIKNLEIFLRNELKEGMPASSGVKEG